MESEEFTDLMDWKWNGDLYPLILATNRVKEAKSINTMVYELEID